MELLDTSPEIDVQAAEYHRLLGYPPGRELSGRAVELAEWARDWYRRNGRPWLYAREAGALDTGGEAIRIDGAEFHSARFLGTLEKARAHGAFLAAMGAGPELEEEALRLWRDEKPDEYFFLEIYGSAVVEHLAQRTGARLCAWADAERLAVLPHYSPGYTGWDIAEQPRLLELLRGQLPAALEVLPSGMLRPKKSQLAVFGITRHTEGIERITDLVPCLNCALPRCQYRRMPYREVRSR